MASHPWKSSPPPRTQASSDPSEPPDYASPTVKVAWSGPIVVLVRPVTMVLLYVALSSVLGLLTPVFISPNGPAVYPYVWGLSVLADLVFVIGSIFVALLVVIGSRRTGSSLLWVPLAYALTFAVYSTADSMTRPDGSCAAGC